ncbi:MAG: protein kinase family protein [Myxococcaceae bacterium]
MSKFAFGLVFVLFHTHLLSFGNVLEDMRDLWLQGNWFSSRLQVVFGKPPGLTIDRIPSGFEINSGVPSVSVSQAASPQRKVKKVDPLGKDLPMPDLGIPTYNQDELKFLGKGASGSVFSAAYYGLKIALKEVNKWSLVSRFMNKPTVTEREIERHMPKIEVEAKTMHHVCGHPNIPRIFGMDNSMEYFRIAMQYAPGCSLERVKLSEQEAKMVMRQLLSALQHCHELGVGHLDVKPANIVWDGQTIKLLDFSISRFFDPEVPENFEGALEGTHEYRPRFSQEQNPVLLDIYGAGVTLRQISREPSQQAQEVIDACLEMRTWIIELQQMSYFD